MWDMTSRFHRPFDLVNVQNPDRTAWSQVRPFVLLAVSSNAILDGAGRNSRMRPEISKARGSSRQSAHPCPGEKWAAIVPLASNPRNTRCCQSLLYRFRRRERRLARRRWLPRETTQTQVEHWFVKRSPSVRPSVLLTKALREPRLPLRSSVRQKFGADDAGAERGGHIAIRKLASPEHRRSPNETGWLFPGLRRDTNSSGSVHRKPVPFFNAFRRIQSRLLRDRCDQNGVGHRPQKERTPRSRPSLV